MGKVKSSPNLQNVKDLAELKRFAGAFLDEIQREFNGRIIFGDNIASSAATTVVFDAAGVVEVAHPLAQVPTGFIIISKSVTVDVWRAPTTWTDTKIYLQSSAGATVIILVI